MQEDCAGDPPIRRSVCSVRAGGGGEKLPGHDDPGGTEDDSDGTYLVPYVVSVFDLVFISDHAASEKSAACAAGVGCCGSDGSDLLRKQYWMSTVFRYCRMAVCISCIICVDISSR